MILADEGLNGRIVKHLRENGFSIDWILELEPGIPDEKVIDFAKVNNQILITEDKDFGEWVFSHKVEGLTIIFLRYEKVDFEAIVSYLVQLLNEELDQPRPPHQFITINKNKIRKREI